MIYTELDESRIIAVAENLHRRISERFPGSGLSNVCSELLATARLTESQVGSILKPNTAVRIAGFILIGIIIAGLTTTLMALRPPDEALSFPEFIQVLEAGINDVVLIGAAVYFVISLEGRFRRRKALAFLAQLRSIIHVIDMHQLTKDPERIGDDQNNTASSPQRTINTRFELNRYLDYCSEMLSITSKLAALYAQGLDDPVVLSSVNEVESLAGGYAQKIWQKLMILNMD